MSHTAPATPGFYGLMAEFDSAQSLLDAAYQVGHAGYTKADAFSPFPIHGLAEALGFKDRRISLFVLMGGIAGALFGYGLRCWTQVIAYPLNIGGRPFHSWVSFIPPTFETTILFAAFTAGLTMIALNGLPQPYHPVFNVAALQRRESGQVLPGDRSGRPEVPDAIRRARSLADSMRGTWWWSMNERKPASVPGPLGPGLRPCCSRPAAVRTCTMRRATTRSKPSPVLMKGAVGAAAGGGHRRARPSPRRRAAPHRQDRRAAGHGSRSRSRTTELDRGEQRYNIYCAPCHGKTGEGNGMVVQRGYKQAASYHIDRLQAMPVGYFFDVISNGFGAMPDYRAQIPVEDRWRIVAYLRALQLSHNGATTDVPARGTRTAGNQARRRRRPRLPRHMEWRGSR